MMLNTSHCILAGGCKHKPTIGQIKGNYCKRTLIKSRVPSTDKVQVGTLENKTYKKEICNKIIKWNLVELKRFTINRSVH